MCIRDRLDFVLWKSAKESEADEVKWDSKWGKGRPGWHIECSAMGSELLGNQFDIHGGGADLQFPHHENEIAQSEGAHQCQYVNYWMHNGFVRVDNEKMSKSLGNFFTIREVLKKYDAEVVRFFILRAHYRSPLNYSDQHLDDAKGALTRLYTALKGAPAEVKAVDWSELYAQRFKAAMDDDFNTPEAVAVLFDLANEVNRGKTSEATAQLKALAGRLGLLERTWTEFSQSKITTYLNAPDFKNENTFFPATLTLSPSHEEISQKIEARLAAKKSKDFAEADRIRKALLEAGIVLEDTPQGTTWRRA